MTADHFPCSDVCACKMPMKAVQTDTMVSRSGQSIDGKFVSVKQDFMHPFFGCVLHFVSPSVTVVCYPPHY